MVPADNERRTGGSPEHVLNYRTGPEPIGAVAVGGAQHDQIWPSGASVQQNDPSCFSVLDQLGRPLQQPPPQRAGSTDKRLVDCHVSLVDFLPLCSPSSPAGSRRRYPFPRWRISASLFATDAAGSRRRR